MSEVEAIGEEIEMTGEELEMTGEEAAEVEISIDPTLGRVSGEICVELLRQYQHMQSVDAEGNVIETSLDNIALTSHRLALIACTGIVPV